MLRFLLIGRVFLQQCPNLFRVRTGRGDAILNGKALPSAGPPLPVRKAHNTAQIGGLIFKGGGTLHRVQLPCADFGGIHVPIVKIADT